MIYLDTNVLIYLFENHAEYATRVADYIDKNSKNNTWFITSTLTITELMAGNEAITVDTLLLLQGLQIVPVSADIATHAGIVMLQDKMHIGDAIHIATAISCKCSTLYTNDDYLAKKAAKSIDVVKP